VKIASKVFDWLVDLVIDLIICWLWFIGTWWEQRKRRKRGVANINEKLKE